MFHFRLFPLDVSEFDPHMNFSHLLDCLKKVVLIEETLDVEQRIEMSGVYLMLNLGSPEALRWAFEVEDRLR